MSERVIVSFCCNDGDNGSPLGKASACHIEDLELVNTLIGGGDVKRAAKAVRAVPLSEETKP